ncbi:DNA helicase RecQ [Intestinibacillus massiliensis]|uniref:DNA helicase RecQ n=1 Tax=Intestinibacillus massiliensis TaxID=1871029 RepID=UPI000B35D901|nr:DNA helicase RecQ [Intestinibacillus massiliensis]
MADARQILQQYFGYDDFRPGQAELVDTLLAGRDVLGVMPTGAGKSLCYQVPALLLPGVTLVISPLISLMADQVNALRESGVPAAYLNSTLTPAQQSTVLRRAAQGQYRLLYVAPERLDTPAFLALAQRVPIPLVAVDEAHCISQWGQDFRPSYLRIPDFLRQLPARPVLGAFTATAAADVRADIAQLLGLHEPLTLTTGFDRPNLYFEVQHPVNKPAALKKLLEGRRGLSGIVYCATRKSVEEVAALVCGWGFDAACYHAGMDADSRRRSQEDFLFDRRTVMVATNAFGMGIDKSNVAFVIHYNMPKNMESYYQEAGRAGRDGSPADCILLYSPQDVRTGQFFIEHSRDADEALDEETRRTVLERERERLRQMAFYCATTDCLRHFILRYFGEHTQGYCGNCSNCNTQFETVDATIDAQKIVSCVYRLAERRRTVGKALIADILHGARTERILEAGFDTLSTYGIMQEMPVRRIRYLLDRLIGAGYLSVSEGEYPVVTLCPRSDEIIRARGPFIIRVPQDMAPRKAARAEAPSGALMDALKQLRKQIATRGGRPAYTVFTDASLADMCRKLPENREEFLSVSGVGQSKADKYGEAFLACIKEHLSAPAN